MMPHVARFLPFLALAALMLSGCDRRTITEALPWQRFTMGSAFMEPTVRKDTTLTGVSVELAELARGDLLVVRHADQYWISRLAGKPGDTIALVGGSVVLNGRPVARRDIGTWTITDYPEPGPVTMQSERFPGESGAHRVLDAGATPADDYAETVLGRDEFFLLSDNRDYAIDSRYPVGLGLGVIRGQDILRRVDADED